MFSALGFSGLCNKLYTKFLFGSERERQALIQDGGLTTSPLFGTRL